MKENTEQHLDELTRKMMNSTELESPSSNFTENIMAHIETIEIAPTPSKPLISKGVWIVIGIIVTALILFSFFGNVESMGWFDEIGYNNIFENNLLSEAFSGITISNTVLYSAVLFGVFILIQVSMLKNYFNKRYQF